MTEADWLCSTDSTQMLVFLGGQPGDPMRSFSESQKGKRKYFLLLCDLCQQIGHLLVDQRIRQAVQVLELFTEGLVTEKEVTSIQILAPAQTAIKQMVLNLRKSTEAHYEAAMAVYHAVSNMDSPWFAAWMVEGYVQKALELSQPKKEERIEERPLAQKLRCLFGNPFRLVTFDLAWRTDNVLAVAQTIYEEHRFSDMPILADALEEAGCTSEEILSHGRSGQEHVRGCWVVDLILGKN